MKNIYQLFHQRITEALQQSNPDFEKETEYIELYCNPTFSNTFLLQIAWAGKEFIWHRTTWEAEKDRHAYEQWFAQIREGIDKMTLHISKASGHQKQLALLLPILSTLPKLKIVPCAYPQTLGRDGYGIVLTIGNENQATTYAWQTCNTMQEWEALDILVEQLLTLNQQLIDAESTAHQLSWEIETTATQQVRWFVVQDIPTT